MSRFAKAALGLGLAFAAIATARADSVSAPKAEAFTRCAACHQATGVGIPGVFPPLNDHLAPFAKTDAGRTFLIMAPSGGLSGMIDVNGTQFMGVMPNQGGIGDDGIAAALNYAILTWNKAGLPAGWKPFTADEVHKVRAKFPDWQPSQGTALREEAVKAATAH